MLFQIWSYYIKLGQLMSGNFNLVQVFTGYVRLDLFISLYVRFCQVNSG